MMNPDDNPFRSPGERAQMVQPAGQIAQVEQQRAIVEMQARILMARRNPRDAMACMDAILADCERPSVAEKAVYAYARGGNDITGPTIHLAENIARRWGNCASGFKILESTRERSEVVSYAWDLETGYYDERQFPVRHWRDTKKGGYPLTDERDVYELVANMAQRRKRAVLLSMLPSDVVDAAVKKCEKTLRANADTSAEGMQKMVDAFSEFGVTRAQIEARIQRRLDSISAAQVVSLKKVYASLRDGMGTAADFFAPDPNAPAANEEGGAGVGSGGTDQPQSAIQKAKEAIRAKAKGKPAPAAEASAGGAADMEAARAEAERSTAEELARAIMPVDLPALRDKLMQAKDRDAAWLVLDSVRGANISPQDHEGLVDLLEQQFPE